MELNAEERAEWIMSTPKPVRRIRANASPMLSPLEDLDEFNGRPISDHCNRAEALLKDETLCRALTECFAEATKRDFLNDYVEQQLYESFPCDATADAMEAVHETPWAQRRAILSRLPDKRYKKLGVRLLYEHAPAMLSDKESESAGTWLRRVMAGDGENEVPWRTLAKARTELETVRADPRFAEQLSLFEEYEAYLRRLEA